MYVMLEVIPLTPIFFLYKLDLFLSLLLNCGSVIEPTHLVGSGTNVCYFQTWVLEIVLCAIPSTPHPTATILFPL